MILIVVHVLTYAQFVHGFLEQFVSQHMKNLQRGHEFQDNDPRISNNSQNNRRVDLLEMVDQQPKVQLNIQLHVGSDEIGFLSAKDMIVELHPDAIVKKDNNRNDDDDDDIQQQSQHQSHTPLPGADGYYRFASSGHRSLDVVSLPRYINSHGEQHIDLQKGCWEACWLKGKPSGTIVIGCSIQQDYHRNDAVLPCGDLWMSFPVWTVDGLQYGQTEKQKIMNEIDINLAKRDDELYKFDQSYNPIMRAIHLHKAFQYAERCNELHDESIDTIPDDDQVEFLQDNLLLSRYGMIWKKHGDGHVLLGEAIAKRIDTSSPSGKPYDHVTTNKKKNHRLKP